MKSVTQIDVLDRKLLETAQDNFPLTRRPWASIGKQLGLTESEVIERLRVLYRKGVIRKIGPAIDAKHVGLHASTLIAMRLPRNRIQKVAAVVAQYQGVSHCYARNHQYNLWFTIAGRDEKELGKMLQEIKRKTKVAKDDVLDLRPTRIFKVDVRFQLT